jgi:hypothetical protein
VVVVVVVVVVLFIYIYSTIHMCDVRNESYVINNICPVHTSCSF